MPEDDPRCIHCWRPLGVHGACWTCCDEDDATWWAWEQARRRAERDAAAAKRETPPPHEKLAERIRERADEWEAYDEREGRKP